VLLTVPASGLIGKTEPKKLRREWVWNIGDLCDNSGRAAMSNSANEDTKTRALSIRQPHAEAIMRGIKKVEYRSAPTRVRGHVYIYASQKRYSAEEEAEMMEDYGITDVSCDDLPRGVLVGTVDLHDCDGGDWHVRKPERAGKLLKPTRRPQPDWFYPF
jgi:hypothetical protein